MSIDLDLWIKPVNEDGIGERFQVCEATFNYVAVDAEGKPRKIERNV